jgi:hypothetical protein
LSCRKAAECESPAIVWWLRLNVDITKVLEDTSMRTSLFGALGGLALVAVIYHVCGLCFYLVSTL